jgi:tubulin polyglutamylase TTLL4
MGTEFQLRYKVSEGQSVYNAVANTLKRAGFKQTSTETCWNIRWGRHLQAEEYRELKPFQKLNHFPGTWHLGRKDLLAKNIAKSRRMYGSTDYNFVPDTFLLPDDRSLLESRMKQEPDALWIIKPPASSCGRGIKVVSSVKEINWKKKWVISRYVSNPLLLSNKCKFDLRIYILVTCFDPLRIYMYNDGLVRFATKQYSTKKKTLKQRYMHLTNYSVNKHSATFVKNEDPEEADFGSKWSLKSFKEILTADGVNVPQLFANIHSVVIKTLLSIESTVNSLSMRTGCRWAAGRGWR